MTIHDQITDLEERLRQAELAPDPNFFQEFLADDAVFVTPNGQPTLSKSKVVEAHRPKTGHKFTRVEMSEMQIFDHTPAAVVTCQGVYEGPQTTVTMKFMRIWLKK